LIRCSIFIDLAAYDAYIQGKLQNYAYPAEKIQEAVKHLPEVPEAALT